MKNLKQLRNLTVLYVDDDREACIKLEKILNYYFSNVYVCDNVNDAMKIYKDNRCNLLLVDYDMPIMNGYEFIKEIRKENDKIPAVIISSYDDKEKLFNAIELQLIAYLVKPYSMDELKDIFYKSLEWIENKGLFEISLGKDKIYSYTTKKIYIKGEEIALSPSEFKILELLLNNENQLVSYVRLIDKIGENSTHKSLINQMHKLKKKIGDDIIKNIKDFGYIFTKK